MTDRIKALTVVLAPNTRDHDAAPIADAIRLLRGVVSVTAHVDDLAHHVAVETAKIEMRKRIREIVE